MWKAARRARGITCDGRPSNAGGGGREVGLMNDEW